MSVRDSLQNLRRSVRVSETEARRTGALLVGAATLGAMSRPGEDGSRPIDTVPSLFGMPKTVSLAIGLKVAASYATGSTADYLNGAGDAASVVAVRDFFAGATVAGVTEPEVVAGRHRSRADRVRALEQKLTSRLPSDELDELEEAAGMRR
jgi:hypothetical protein